MIWLLAVEFPMAFSCNIIISSGVSPGRARRAVGGKCSVLP